MIRIPKEKACNLMRLTASAIVSTGKSLEDVAIMSPLSILAREGLLACLFWLAKEQICGDLDRRRINRAGKG